MKKAGNFSDRSKDSFPIVIVSSCPEDWGGSEELWAQTAVLLTQAGHTVHIFKTNVNRQHPRIRDLLVANCPIIDLNQLPPWPTRIRNRLLPGYRQHSRHWGKYILTRALRALKPRLTLIAQGNNFDGMPFAEVCRQHGHPYALIAQKAVEFSFPHDSERATVQAAYQSAQHCFFVSQHNLRITRHQLSMALPQATVVFNPVNPCLQAAFSSPAMPDPTPDRTFRLACVARLDMLDKGQDLLLTVLTQPKWRSRPLRLTLFGDGPHRKAAEEMVHFLDLNEQVCFGGHVSDPGVIWQTHHALILPSRSEGLPLALVEAMLCHRPAVATDAGGIAELLIDNVTGFLAATASVDAIDEAMERAWNRRTDWPLVGRAAAQHVNATVPANAALLFCDQILQLTEMLH